MDLSKQVNSYLYVDGANDSGSKKSDNSSISSDILETQMDLTQPATPPAQLSQSGDTLVLLINDSEASHIEDKIANNDNANESTITITNFSTITVSTHRTFDSRNNSDI